MTLPTPQTSNFPVPRDWEEFEDICADLLRELWKDPYVKRYGRSGQAQHGIDILGAPGHLSDDASKIAGAQCKNSSTLEIEVIRKSVALVKKAPTPLTEFLILTTASRDARIDDLVLSETWPFQRLIVLFWEDICSALSRWPELITKHFPLLASGSTSLRQIYEKIIRATPTDFDFEDVPGIWTFRDDVALRLTSPREEDSEPFHEPWVENFCDRRAFVNVVHFEYNGRTLGSMYFARVDGARAYVPYPLNSNDLRITSFQYHVAKIINHHVAPHDSYRNGIDNALRFAKIEVSPELVDPALLRVFGNEDAAKKAMI